VKKILKEDSSVLFVLIGWARYYDGTEQIQGGHRYLQKNPDNNGEAQAFVKQSDGFYRCGAGSGKLHENHPDIVFVARNPRTTYYEVVALYRKCITEIVPDYPWCTVKTKSAVTFPPEERPHCSAWPGGQGMRRWARRNESKGAMHDELLNIYKSIMKKSPPKHYPLVDIDPELSAFEGEQKKLFVRHRKREQKLRAAKIRDALQKGGGHLVCEVPNCSFDFYETYGEIGHNFAVVHHTKPLAWIPRKGARILLTDLAIVCANCHAMIHRGGECRDMATLIPKKT
jgi:hypothetical protein